MSDAEGRRDGLLGELERERAAFVAAFDDVEPDLLTTPGLMGDWSARDVVVHVAWWSEHGARAVELAVTGRGADFTYDSSDTDAMNARIAEEASAVSPRAAREREASAFEALRAGLASLDPELLELRLGNGDTVEKVIRYDGPDHYAEHTAHLRAWWSGSDDVVEDDHDQADLARMDGESDRAD